MQLVFNTNQLAEKWDSFRPMIFQGFSKQCPTDFGARSIASITGIPMPASLVRRTVGRCLVAPTSNNAWAGSGRGRLAADSLMLNNLDVEPEIHTVPDTRKSSFIKPRD
jgi:hypothetical protein